MINEFDKEIDSLLRKTARTDGAVLTGSGAHVDADEISLFVENALSVKARTRVTGHLADCRRCRNILSNLISINSETESENVHAKEVAAIPVSIPWYKKLFAFPQLAYAMGALALVFSGVIAIMFLQNVRESQNASIAKIEQMQETPQTANAESSEDSVTSDESSSMSNSNAATAGNTAMTSNTATTVIAPDATAARSKPVVQDSAESSNSSVFSDEKTLTADKDAKTVVTTTATAPPPPPKNKLSESAKKEDFVADAPAAAPSVRSENDAREDNENLRLSRQQTENQNLLLQNQARMMPDTQSPRAAAGAAPVQRAERRSAPTATTTTSDLAAAESKNRNSATRNFGGKTFKRADGVWYDSAYNQQRTTNVRRGSEDYKRLDSNLRSIAENVGGIVVVVWKGKAYRIQ